MQRWQGDRGTYHLVNVAGEQAEVITTHAALHRMEFGKQRGFGSVKVIARIGGTEWKTSVFPQKIPPSQDQAGQKQWVLLVSKKVMRAEHLTEGELIKVELELL